MIVYPAISPLTGDRHAPELVIGMAGLGDRHRPDSLIVFTGIRKLSDSIITSFFHSNYQRLI
jgi:hypothetical protein